MHGDIDPAYLLHVTKVVQSCILEADGDLDVALSAAEVMLSAAEVILSSHSLKKTPAPTTPTTPPEGEPKKTKPVKTTTKRRKEGSKSLLKRLVGKKKHEHFGSEPPTDEYGWTYEGGGRWMKPEDGSYSDVALVVANIVFDVVYDHLRTKSSKRVIETTVPEDVDTPQPQSGENAPSP